MILSLLACITPPHIDPGPDPETWVPPQVVEGSAAWAAEQAESALYDGVGRGLPAASLGVESVAVLWDVGDERCPGGTTESMTAIEGCTTESGWNITGIGGFQDLDDRTSAVGEFQAYGPDDEYLAVGGTWLNTLDTVDALTVLGGTVYGSFWLQLGAEWATDAKVGGWVEWELSFGDGLESGYLQGPLMWDDASVDFELGFGSDAGCEAGSAAGAVRIRDPDGGWWSLELEDCTQCGVLSFEGVEQGTACTDIEGLVVALEGLQP